MALQQIDFLFAGLTDTNGEPLTGGKVYSYYAGTNTSVALYQDYNGVSAHANPLILDSAGRAQAYAYGALKFVIKDANDVVQYTWDGMVYRFDGELPDDIYLKLAGGTMTGALAMTTATVGGKAVVVTDDVRMTNSRKCDNTFDAAATARTNLGLGGAAVLNVGTTAGTVCAGDDARFAAIGGSTHPLYPTAFSATTCKATSTFNTDYVPHFCFDPGNSTLGDSRYRCWASADNASTNQRLHVDLGAAKTLTHFVYHNFHNVGLDTNRGAKYFTLWGSNEASAFAELTYATDTNWTQLTTSLAYFNAHAAANAHDPMTIFVTQSTPYRYYALKFADSWGGPVIAVRRIELWGS